MGKEPGSTGQVPSYTPIDKTVKVSGRFGSFPEKTIRNCTK